MAAWCLPKEHADAFLEALKAGRISPRNLIDMTSEERRTFFADIVGAENAKEVNAQFEAKLLLKNQQAGIINWARKVAGLTESARDDIVSRIQRMDKILQPADMDDFLHDLAAKKLHTEVTADEAQRIFDFSSKAEQARATMQADISNVPNRVAYGRALLDLNDYVESIKPDGRTFADKAIDILNIPKSALTSVLHFSAPFVQGWGMLSTRRAWQAFGQMFKYFADEEHYQNLNAYIISHPDYNLAKDGKLGITKLGDRLSTREEAIQSTLVEKANEWLSERTGVPNLVRASSRAFTGYLNYVRFNRFTDLLNAARQVGEDVGPGSKPVHDIAKVVNDFTGRGAIGVGDKYAQSAPALNALFFSPRKISATIQMFEPVHYFNLSPTARQAAIRQLSGSLIATGAVLGIAKAMGANVSFDPRDADFGKVVIGNAKFDFTGSNATYIRLLGRLATNQEVTSAGHLINLGKGYKPTTRGDLVQNYIRGKLSPVASAAANWLYGEDLGGHPFSITKEAQDELIPITMKDWFDHFYYDPNNTVATIPAMAAIFGVGMETTQPRVAKTTRSTWGGQSAWP